MDLKILVKCLTSNRQNFIKQMFDLSKQQDNKTIFELNETNLKKLNRNKTSIISSISTPNFRALKIGTYKGKNIVGDEGIQYFEFAITKQEFENLIQQVEKEKQRQQEEKQKENK